MGFFVRQRQFSAWFLKCLQTRPRLQSMAQRFMEWYNVKMGYRQYGLLRDDIINDETPIVAEALSRLDEKVVFDRNFRLRRAMQLHMNKEVLSPDEQTAPGDDKPYLFPVIEQVAREKEEREMYDKYEPKRPK